MSNREVDYEKQFQDDLEKATALSLETLALDQFRRSKLGYITPAETTASINYHHQTQTIPATTHHTSPPRPENDLISFASPTVKQNKPEDENPTLKFLKDLNQQYSSPATPQGMQIVPYYPSGQQEPPPPPSNQQLQLQTNQPQRLTNEELQKLYSMAPPTMPPLNQYNTTNVFTPQPQFRQSVPSIPAPSSYGGYYGFVVPQPQSIYPNLHQQPPITMLQQPPPQSTAMLHQQPQTAFQPLSTEKALVLRTSSPAAGVVVPSGPQQSIPVHSITRSNSGSSISLAASMPSSAAAQVNAEMKRKLSKKQSSIAKDDLIDLGVDDSKVSVLEAFDPLLCRDDEYGNDDASDCTSNYYPEYDPFDYLYSEGTQYSDPVYEAVNKKDRTPISPANSVIGWKPELFSSKDYDSLRSLKSLNTSSPPPLPPRNNSIPSSSSGQHSNQELLDRRKNMPKLYEVITDRKTVEPELLEFYHMVKEVRSNYRYDDESTNIGHVVASEFNYLYPEGTEIKILVHPILDILKQDCEATQGGQISGYGAPITFTSVVESIVEMVVGQAVCSLEGQLEGSVDQYSVKPIGLMEWLSPTTKLSQLEYVHNCMKLGNDVNLGLCLKANMNTIARTERDDRRDSELKPEDILPTQTAATMSYSDLMILIETLEEEMRKLEVSASENSSHISCSCVEQNIKLICALFGEIDTLEINAVLDDLKKTCSSGQLVYSPYSNPNIVSENGDYAEVTLRPKSFSDQIKLKCNQLREVTQELIEIYSNAFRVNFFVKTVDYITTPISVSNVLKPIMVHISCLHRPAKNWKYDDYILAAQLYHGTRYMHREPLITQCSNDMSGGLYQRLKFDTWIEFPKNPICTLPRESRIIFVLYGTEPVENEQSGNNENNGEKKQIRTELGWCSIQLFDFQREMINGSHLLSLWPPTTDKFLGPAPSKGSHPHSDICPVLSIEIPTYGGRVVFPEAVENPPSAPRYDFNSLDNNLQQELLDTADQGYPGGALDKREVFWEKRHYLQDFPHALPKVLHAAHSWDYASLIDLHSLLKSWKPLSPLQAMELLLPRYPDAAVRAKAVEWISLMPNEQLVDFLPQLLQALKHDTYEASPMARFLLSRCLECPRIAHHMYWLLLHSLPGDSPQNTQVYEKNEPLVTQARYHRRNKMMLRALLTCCGERFASKLISQDIMCLNLAAVARAVKESKESMRLKEMQKGLEGIQQNLMDNPTTLPLGPGLEVSGISIRNCNYFNSNTLPIKIAFMGPDKTIFPAIFKAGDDLQQDMLTIQLVRVMNKLWLAEKLDLKIVTFDCVPTGYRKGMIEMVSDAETLRKIQVEYGLTGSFKDRPIAEWLAKQNPSQLEYDRAVNNFTASCAGYSVATYILGICDRHNDNIMLKTSGHLFHIDFGKFLGDAQMFGNFKRDRTPFVLTSDMAYVINGGDKPSIKFHTFVDTCCRAFNIVRKHGDLILQMLALMASAGIPGVTANAVQYVRNALMPTQSNPEAAASFAKMIQSSLKSWFTQFNFFLHNIASMRFTNDEGSGELLSFVPRKYTLQQDGKLKSVTVLSHQKRYDMEKYYTYILKVERHGNPDPSYLFRSYKEFTEFHQKLCLHFPLVKLHSLPSGIHVGRSNIKSVAERRQPEIKKFLESLFNSVPEIAHSDLVYTFFHPLLRDQQEYSASNIHLSKVKEKALRPPENNANPESHIKISLQYRRETLTVMIHHAKGLSLTNGGQEPNTYVKCYLKPDPTKATKRKTKVVRKTCVPSFMETLEYRMPLELIQTRSLNVTIWSHDSLQENELLGGFTLDLSKLNLMEEISGWYRLEYQPRHS